jgi:hypothetical protein
MRDAQWFRLLEQSRIGLGEEVLRSRGAIATAGREVV